VADGRGPRAIKRRLAESMLALDYPVISSIEDPGRFPSRPLWNTSSSFSLEIPERCCLRSSRPAGRSESVHGPRAGTAGLPAGQRSLPRREPRRPRGAARAVPPFFVAPSPAFEHFLGPFRLSRRRRAYEPSLGRSGSEPWMSVNKLRLGSRGHRASGQAGKRCTLPTSLIRSGTANARML
jgi:hypothetical protein